MRKWLKIVMVCFAVVFCSVAIAQNADPETKDGVMRSYGKIYVVLTVVLTILCGLLFYVVRLDRKISKLEKGEV
jgi:hypothetical protein